MVCGMFVWCSMCASVCMLTVSNALLMSSATVLVRSGGLFWLKHVAIVLFMLCNAVLVEWLLLKPCCLEMCGMLFVMYGSSVFSSVFAITERSEMGLYDVPMFMSLYGFGIGRMFASFHVRGMMLLFSDVLYVRYASLSGPLCLRCLLLTLSGPVEFFLLCFIAAWTCMVVSVILVVCSLSVFLSMCLFVLCVLCLTVLVNCLLNAFAICVGEVTVFSLKMIVFIYFLFILLANPCIVFQRGCVLCL